MAGAAGATDPVSSAVMATRIRSGPHDGPMPARHWRDEPRRAAGAESSVSHRHSTTAPITPVRPVASQATQGTSPVDNGAPPVRGGPTTPGTPGIWGGDALGVPPPTPVVGVPPLPPLVGVPPLPPFRVPAPTPVLGVPPFPAVVSVMPGPEVVGVVVPPVSGTGRARGPREGPGLGAGRPDEGVVVEGHRAVAGERPAVDRHAVGHGDGGQRQDVAAEDRAGSERGRAADLPEDVALLGTVDERHGAARTR